MEDSLEFLPYVMMMAPSIAIVFVYMSISFFIGVFISWDEETSSILRMVIMMGLTAVIFFGSVTIGQALQYEISEAMVRSTTYNMTIHEEFLIGLCVEMLGAVIIVPLIYGTDDRPQKVILSLVLSLFFLWLVFAYPIGDYFRTEIGFRNAISANYVDNMRVELLSLLFLFVPYRFFISLTPSEDEDKNPRSTLYINIQLLLMIGIVGAVIWYFRYDILAPEYENLSLAISAGILSGFVIAVAKASKMFMIATLLITGLVSCYLLLGTQLPDFGVSAPMCVNLSAEIIGAVTVAMVLDAEVEV